MLDTWTPTKTVSHEQASAVRDIVIEHFRSWTHDQEGNLFPLRELPVLHAPRTGWGDHWYLVWVAYSEVPPYQWETLATIGGQEGYTGGRIEPATFPPDVHCEGVSIGVMGIYPA